MTLSNLKIVSLTSENIKRLTAVHIAPDGNVVQITGKNEQGKTSVLDSIWWALAGLKHIQSAPIRKGATTARIRLDLGEIIVTRKFTEAGSTLTVTTADGAKYPNPQTMLDALVGAISFDPLAFSRMAPATQYALLTKMVPLDIDVAALAVLNRADYDRRTEINREVKSLEAQVAAIEVPDTTPEPIDIDATVAEIEAAGAHNASIERRTANRANAENDIRQWTNTATDLLGGIPKLREEFEARVADLEKRAAEATALATQTRADLDKAGPLPEPIDVAPLRDRVAAARAVNETVAACARRKALWAQMVDAQNRADELTKAIEDREASKVAALAAANMPVEGLGLGDGIVTYRDTPFDQASKAVQIRVGMAMAMAMNPALRVIRIEDGSLLDSDSMAIIAGMATDADWQVWIERVDMSGSVGFVIEDGHVRGAEQLEAAE